MNPLIPGHCLGPQPIACGHSPGSSSSFTSRHPLCFPPVCPRAAARVSVFLTLYYENFPTEKSKFYKECLYTTP